MRVCFAVMLLVLSSQTAGAKPNFIVIMVDDMGYSGVSCFGNPYFQTPEFDRLAAEGMKLTDFHSSGTVCSPTRAGLLTGRYQQRAGIEAVIHPVADHPEHRKGSVYEGGHRVPCVAWWPGHITPGTENATPAITLDIMPTLLALAGTETSRERPLDGVDLSGVLLEGKMLPDRPLFWASLSNDGARSEAMRDGPWKLVVRHPKAKPGSFDNEIVQLYQLMRDPGEQTDLADAQPQRAAEMLKRLKAWYADTRRTATPQPGGW